MNRDFSPSPSVGRTKGEGADGIAFGNRNPESRARRISTNISANKNPCRHPVASFIARSYTRRTLLLLPRYRSPFPLPFPPPSPSVPLRNDAKWHYSYRSHIAAERIEFAQYTIHARARARARASDFPDASIVVKHPRLNENQTRFLYAVP